MPWSKKPKHLRLQKHGRHSTFSMTRMAEELHELLEIPLQRYGRWYEPTKGRQILAAIVNSMVAALQRGETVTIKNFGQFVPFYTKPMQHYPLLAQDGTRSTKLITSKPRKTVRFIPSPYLSAITNQTRGFELTKNERRSLNKWKYSPPPNSPKQKPSRFTRLSTGKSVPSPAHPS